MAVSSSKRIVRTGRGIVVAVLALVIVVMMLGHELLPNIGGIVSLGENVLPWIGVLIVVLAVVALFLGSRVGLAGVLVAAIVWAILFVPGMLPAASASTGSAGSPSSESSDSSGSPGLTIASENVEAGNGDAAGLARDLASRHPDLIALQELDGDSRAAVADEIDGDYPYNAIVGTVGLWSTMPIDETQQLDLGLGWNRALWADIETGSGLTRVYVVHLASVRVGQQDDRDTMIEQLAATLAADESERLVVVGDFNTATTDRAFSTLTDAVPEPARTEFGLGFTWPSFFPIVRLDHVLVRGYDVARNVVLEPNGSDHRGILIALS
ncbi:endonuclease/exonuclease/phosphatase family protein [Compostimonas suwonensis]|uniref:Vancomycin resistance protein VanJ n=1 Tax=Compostimonas suwonensis TaxID=1048394 RepID=A0A2M9BZL5_9MICO|nr:endonuclease/exonuclease/phosphatase family protein [Compostimonas suwonensis]PJJ63541.1 vancomycin resistance protein VanJ [Compostimonas suwonensis]